MAYISCYYVAIHADIVVSYGVEHHGLQITPAHNDYIERDVGVALKVSGIRFNVLYDAAHVCLVYAVYALYLIKNVT